MADEVDQADQNPPPPSQRVLKLLFLDIDPPLHLRHIPSLVVDVAWLLLVTIPVASTQINQVRRFPFSSPLPSPSQFSHFQPGMTHYPHSPTWLATLLIGLRQRICHDPRWSPFDRTLRSLLVIRPAVSTSPALRLNTDN